MTFKRRIAITDVTHSSLGFEVRELGLKAAGARICNDSVSHHVSEEFMLRDILDSANASSCPRGHAPGSEDPGQLKFGEQGQEQKQLTAVDPSSVAHSAPRYHRARRQDQMAR